MKKIREFGGDLNIFDEIDWRQENESVVIKNLLGCNVEINF